MRIAIIALIFLTLIYIYEIYKQIIKIKKRKFVLTISIAVLLLTISIEYPLVRTKEIDLKILLAYSIISVVYFLILFITNRKKETITNQSIKEAIDLSNSGILVLKNKNTIKLQNSIMRELLSELEINKNYIEELKNKATRVAQDECTILIDDKAWLFIINEQDLEIIAITIDEEYKLHQIIEKQNKEIEANNKEIMWTIENMEYIEKEKESQELKSKFHDLLGQSFSMLQQYLNQEDLESKNIEDIKFMIREMFTDIEDTDEPEVNLKNLIEAHKNTGTDIDIIGTLPKDRKIEKVFFEIIREAVTNAIRHADSTKITVQIKDELEKTELIITNNGKTPKNTIIEQQGIKGMRRRVEGLNGKLFITTNPEFKIHVII